MEGFPWSLHAIVKPDIEDAHATAVETLKYSMKKFMICSTYRDNETNAYTTPNSHTLQIQHEDKQHHQNEKYDSSSN